jgi:integrase
VIKRGAGWSYVIDLDPIEGKRRQKWVSGFDSRKAAESAMRTAITKLENGGDPFPEDMTMTELKDRYLASASVRNRPRTVHRYQQLMSEAVAIIGGSVLVARVRRAHIQAVFDHMAGRGLCPGTI